jgi:hypothetical protein
MSQQPNWEKEAAKLKTLLRAACDTINQYYPELMNTRLAIWYSGERMKERLERIQRSDEGQVAVGIRHIIETEQDMGETL